MPSAYHIPYPLVCKIMMKIGYILSLFLTESPRVTVTVTVTVAVDTKFKAHVHVHVHVNLF